MAASKSYLNEGGGCQRVLEVRLYPHVEKLSKAIFFERLKAHAELVPSLRPELLVLRLCRLRLECNACSFQGSAWNAVLGGPPPFDICYVL